MIMQTIAKFSESMGFTNLDIRSVIMIGVSLLFIWLAIKKNSEPLLLIPIGFGMLMSNLPLSGVYSHDPSGAFTEWGILTIFFKLKPILPSLIFLGVGVMTDFGSLIANPRSLVIGAAAQFGVFAAFFISVTLGFNAQEAASIGIIGGADGPTCIFLTTRLAPQLLGSVAVAAYSYMALVPVIQPPFMKLLTTRRERNIVMEQLRPVSQREKIIFPIMVTVIVCLFLPPATPLIGCLMLGNLLKESGRTRRLADTASNSLCNIVTILLGLSVGGTAQGTTFLTFSTIKIIIIGVLAFSVGTVGGVIIAKIMNLISGGNSINPLIGSAGVSAVPMAARVSQKVGQQYNSSNYLLMHAMGPNVSGVIGSSVAAGVFLSMFS